MSSSANPRVSYYYDSDVGNYTYGPNHPMKPHRMRMVHSLVTNYGLYKKMTVIRPDRATPLQMTRYHTDEYINFLYRVTPETLESLGPNGATRYNVGDDCPVFDGLFEFCSISAGGSIAAANQLNSGLVDTAINWSGGLHHAKRREASGFCYVNDIVLGALELLRFHQRVLYIDIDIHHGDGVEEAFYTTDRVMTCSFHKFGDYFPGTGDIRDTGMGKGKKYAVNVPLQDGIDDDTYQGIFRSVISHIMQWYRPGAVILQCGADSLAGDRLGCFNLSMRGHAACVAFMKTFNVPLMVVGGGGYTIRNVARAWTYETSILLDTPVSEDLPYNDYFEYYGPDYKLKVEANNMENMNSPKYLERIKQDIIENLRSLPYAPSVGMHEVPSDIIGIDEQEEEAYLLHQEMRDRRDGILAGPSIRDPEAAEADSRLSQRLSDARIVPNNEFSDSEDELERSSLSRPAASSSGQRSRHVQSYAGRKTGTNPAESSLLGRAVSNIGRNSPYLPPTNDLAYNFNGPAAASPRIGAVVMESPSLGALADGGSPAMRAAVMRGGSAPVSVMQDERGRAVVRVESSSLTYEEDGDVDMAENA